MIFFSKDDDLFINNLLFIDCMIKKIVEEKVLQHIVYFENIIF